MQKRRHGRNNDWIVSFDTVNFSVKIIERRVFIIGVQMYASKSSFGKVDCLTQSALVARQMRVFNGLYTENPSQRVAAKLFISPQTLKLNKKQRATPITFSGYDGELEAATRNVVVAADASDVRI